MRRQRLSLLFLVAAAIVLALSSPPVQAPTTVTTILASTDRLEYINVSGFNTVQATAIIFFNGTGPPPTVHFLWYGASAADLLRDRYVVATPRAATEAVALDAWTADRTGLSLSVHASVNRTDPPAGDVLWSNTTFTVLPPSTVTPRPTLSTVLLVASAAGLGLSLAAVVFVRYRALLAAGGHGLGQRRMPTKLEAGGSYVVVGSDPSRGYRIFATYVNAGAKGLVLSRLYPDEVRTRHAVGPSEVLWLSRGYGPSAVNPTDLDRLVNEIERHVVGREASIVLLDHVDYLVRQNGSPAVAKFLERLTDAVSTHGSRLLVPIDPAGVASADLAKFTRDLRNV